MSSTWTSRRLQANGFFRGAAIASRRTPTCSICPARAVVIQPQHAFRHVDRGTVWLERCGGVGSLHPVWLERCGGARSLQPIWLKRCGGAGSRRAVWLRRSVSAASPIRDLLLRVVELQHGEADDEGHENGRLRAGGAEVETDEAVLVQLEDHDRRGVARAALGHRVDDAERFEEGEDHVEGDEVEGDG